MTKPKIPMREKDIDARLTNWGMCQRGRGGGGMVARETRRTSPYGGQGYQCMTAVVIARMREAAKGPAGGSATQSKLDFGDAATIQQAWATLSIRHRLLLRDYYVLGNSASAICRSLDIKHWPARHFQNELKAAQAAIESAVDKETA